MRVLHVYKDYAPVMGGIEGHIQTLARAQAARGLAVSILVTRPDGLRTVRGDDPGTPPDSTSHGAHGSGTVEVIRAGRLLTARSTPLSPQLPLLLASARPDIVHLHAPYPPGELAQLLFRRGRATVIGYHSDVVRQRWLGSLWRPLQRRLLRRADRVLVASHAYRESSPALRAADARCTVIPYGIDLARFARPDPVRIEAWRARFPGPKTLFVGRLRYYKGIAHLIDAVATHEQGHLLIAGRGPMETAWRLRAAATAGRQRIHFLGDVAADDLAALYAAADLFVLPSTHRSEAFGIVLLEAMAAGLPVVSTELGTGTSEINIDGETGRVVPPSDPTALASALRGLLADEATRQSMGAAGRARAERLYGVETMVDAVGTVYNEVTRTASGSRHRRAPR